MSNLTPSEKDIIRIARSLIRDAAMDWARDEVIHSPEFVCEKLSEMLGEEYDFESGEEHQAYDVRKLDLYANTVLRKNTNGELFLVNYKNKGWASSAIPFRSEKHLLDNYNVVLGNWMMDEFSEYRTVTKIKKPK